MTYVSFRISSLASALMRLLRSLTAPRLQNKDLRNRELVLNVLLVATIGFLALAVAFLAFYYVALDKSLLLPRIGVFSIALLFLIGLYILSRTRHYIAAAYLFLFFYVMLTTSMIMYWGTNLTVGIVLYGLIIVLAGILLGARYSLFAAVGITMLLATIQLAIINGHIMPDLTWTTAEPRFGDIVGACFVFGVLAVASWLFNRQMEHSLHLALRAEVALTRQKVLLEVKVEERTRELQAMQLEKVQQLYRFAELGQLSTALLHELANHLTTLTLDIETIQERDRSRLVKRAKRNIKYIDDMVGRVRDQLHGKSRIKVFGVSTEIDEVVSILSHKARLAHVSLHWQAPANKRQARCEGDPSRFRQMLANIISNAIDSYEGGLQDSTESQAVILALTVGATDITVTISDTGKGIPPDHLDYIFDPFYSTKDAGMGMGLFIARQVVENDFGGKLTAHSGNGQTIFSIVLKKFPTP